MPKPLIMYVDAGNGHAGGHCTFSHFPSSGISPAVFFPRMKNALLPPHFLSVIIKEKQIVKQYNELNTIPPLRKYPDPYTQ